mmetsp:Transcript_24633/g.41374  ORF Transcript_24633/g.41374 Transcript_24633/m.41374 type:complete len:158 (+) Transcript_24633:1147-1620(+)
MISEFDRYLQLKTQILRYSGNESRRSSNNNVSTTTPCTEFPISTDISSGKSSSSSNSSSSRIQNQAGLNGFVSPTARSISTLSSPRLSSSSTFVERNAGTTSVSRNLISPLKQSREEVHSPLSSPPSKELDKQEARIMHEWEPRNRTDMQLDAEAKR